MKRRYYLLLIQDVFSFSNTTVSPIFKRKSTRTSDVETLKFINSLNGDMHSYVGKYLEDWRPITKEMVDEGPGG